jgi:hypothetical protein
MKVLVRYTVKKDEAGKFWIEVEADGQLCDRLGPHDSMAEIDRVMKDFEDMLGPFGAKA